MRRGILLLAMLAALGACGIKGDPVTPRPDPPRIPPAGEDGGLEL
jgi:hypothetical protein